MTLFQIALRNLRKNFKSYFLYIGSMIFSIVIYFTFVSLKYDTAIQKEVESFSKVNGVFNAASVVLIVFVAIFIWYSNAFFVKKRKKEVGLYSLLGVRKKQIGWMLFFENFMIGVIALLVGIAIGSLLSKLFVALLMKIMGYEIVTGLMIAPAAIIHTAIVFLLIIMMTSIHGYRLIYQFQLIELFKAEQERETEPKSSLLVTVLSVLLIAVGYYLASQSILESPIWNKLGFMPTALIILTTVILGTYFLFSTLTVYVLKYLRKRKKHFWHGMNLISTSQLLYRMKGNARTLTVIAILSATTITAVGTAYSLYYNNTSNAKTTAPNSLMFVETDEQLSQEIEKTIEEAENHDIRYHEAFPVLRLDVELTSLQSPYLPDVIEYSFIDEQTFHRLAEHQGHSESVSLTENEAVVLDISYSDKRSPNYVGASLPLEVGHKQEEIHLTDVKEYNVLNIGTSGMTMVISERLFAEFAKETDVVQMEAYGLSNDEKMEDLSKNLASIIPEEARFSSFYEGYAAGMETSGLLIFIGGFLGLVFLSATGSIIYFKQLNEATVDQGRYTILHNIGVNRKEMKRSIARQVLFVFLLPLLVGVSHAVVALMALSHLMEMNLVVPVTISIVAYAFIYTVYYFITVRNYYKIVTE